MASIQWIKITTDIFDDEKILLIESMPEADAIIVIWFKLLTLAGRQNMNGLLTMTDRIHYTEEMLATIFRRNLNTVRLALNVFEQFGMIEIINDIITIPNWEKHQSADKMEKVKEQTRLRVAKHREKQKQLVSNVTGNVTVTQSNALEEEREEEKEKEKEISSSSINNKGIDYTVQQLLKDFEAGFGRLLSPFEIEDIQKYISEEQFKPDVIREALKTGIYQGKPIWNYIKGILRNWKSENISTVEQILAREKEQDVSKREPLPPDLLASVETLFKD